MRKEELSMGCARLHLHAALIFFALLGHASAQEIVFASAEEGRRFLSTRDDYVQSMSAFDRAARMKTERDVTESEYLAFAAKAPLDWEREERELVEAAYKDIQPAIARLRLPLPARIYFVKTSGVEDAHAAYTRQNAIVLPARILGSLRDRGLRRLIAHELFHVSTRANPKLVGPLYEVIGFHACGEVELPAGLRARRITNPDAPKDQHCIRVNVANEKVWALPVLFSLASKEDIARGGEFLDNVTVGLLLVDKPAGGAVARPLMGPTGPRFLKLGDVTGFFEQIGRNTKYLIHPEEILADNFALLAIGERNVASPAILAGIEKVLENFGDAQAAQPRR
jgi:hypothetical protein